MGSTRGTVLSVNVGGIRQFEFHGREAVSAIRVVGPPDHGLTVGDVFRICMRDRDEVARLLSVPQMSSSWTQWAEVRTEKSERRATADAPGCC